jgi:hypothetical protein
MSPRPAPGRVPRSRRHRRDGGKRRLAVVVAIAVVAVGTLLVTAFGGGDHPTAALTAPASAARLLPAGPPGREAVARIGTLTIDLPVNASRLTAVGFYAASDGALGLSPLGPQANEGLLKRLAGAILGSGSHGPRWYLLPGGTGSSTSALDIGAPSGTDVYAPVDGTIVGIDKVIIAGRHYGQTIDIQPTLAPSLVVTVSNLAADPSLSVGSMVTTGSSKLGELLDLSRVQKQELAGYTNDAGNHVLIEVHPAATPELG